MRYTNLCVSILALVGMIAAPVARAGDIDLAQTFDPKSAYEVLKTLDGQWEGTAVSKLVGSDDEGESGPAAVDYRVSANGSTVVATYGAGTQMEMLTVYHLNGPDELMLTHYCALRNQPQMKLEAVDEKGMLKFAFAGGTNFDPKKDRHSHEATLRIIDKDTIETTSVGYNQGKPSTIRKATLKRVK